MDFFGRKNLKNGDWRLNYKTDIGEMVEWFKAAVLKTAEAQASGSSNLPLSAIYYQQVTAILEFPKRRIFYF